jgi:fumarate reductase iron-sulfur subunit
VVQDGRLEVAPLRNLPIVKDLVADLTPFFDKWVAAGGRFAGTEAGEDGGDDRRTDGARAAGTDGFARVAPDSVERQAADTGIECIGCAVCYASCDVVAWNPDYLGPAALNRAWTLVNDVRDAERAQRLDAVTSERGCLSCHSLQSCTERCPMQLDPAGSIAGLKRLAVKRAFGGGL